MTFGPEARRARRRRRAGPSRCASSIWSTSRRPVAPRLTLAGELWTQLQFRSRRHDQTGVGRRGARLRCCRTISSSTPARTSVSPATRRISKSMPEHHSASAELAGADRALEQTIFLQHPIHAPWRMPVLSHAERKPHPYSVPFSRASSTAARAKCAVRSVNIVNIRRSGPSGTKPRGTVQIVHFPLASPTGGRFRHYEHSRTFRRLARRAVTTRASLRWACRGGVEDHTAGGARGGGDRRGGRTGGRPASRSSIRASSMSARPSRTPSSPNGSRTRR